MAAPKLVVQQFRQELLDVVGRYTEVPRAEKALWLARLLCAEVGGKLGGWPTREEFLRVCGHAYDLVMGKTKEPALTLAQSEVVLPRIPTPDERWLGVFRWLGQ